MVLTSVHCWPDVRRGGERYAHELSAALRRAGHDVRILSTGIHPGRDRVLDVPVQRLPVRHARRRNFPPPWSDLAIERAFGAQAFGHLAPAFLAGRFDVWHATSTGDGAAAAWCGAVAGRLHSSARTVFTDHGFPARASRDARPDRAAHATVVRRIGAYVCVSKAAADCLARDYGRTAAVVPPGVDVSAHEVAKARADRPTVLYAGSLTESRKGLPLLLAAVDQLLRREPNLQLWLLGPGDAAPLLSATTAEVRAAVTMCKLASDAELRAAYAKAWVTALPSTAESFGMTVVESLASGTPAVVRADGGGPAEIVDDDRIGRCSGPDAASLADAIGETLDLARQADTADACRERARAYDWDAAVVPALEQVYAGARP
ncbi:MAG: glycosyltransferase family 4 protein [Frankiales bacterium]|nr:glycosyltransferase family 4 protein [Frankiales bacterium]